jgi:hypothetical protein
MEIAESRKKHSCLVVPGTARYQYHLFQQDNIVGPTWPWPGPGRSLARSLSSAGAEQTAKGQKHGSWAVENTGTIWK